MLTVNIAFAADYKPYLHEPSIPDHPEVRLFGQYKTDLFPGAATYNYNIQVPKGIGFTPSVNLIYSSQNNKNSFTGLGWQLSSYDYIYKDINGTLGDYTDDYYYMVLQGNLYELIYNDLDSKWHTEVEYYFKIENMSYGWQVYTNDGTRYLFNSSDETKWVVDKIQDTHGNSIYFNYTDDLLPEAIEYSGIEIDFEYEQKPNRVLSFLYNESQRLKNITISDSDLLRSYEIDYVNNSLLCSISFLNQTINFSYYDFEEGYDNTSWQSPVLFSNGPDDYGVRLVDVNNDGLVDIIQRNDTSSQAYLNNKSGWEEDDSWIVPVDIVSSSDEGVRFFDVDNDGYTDLLKSKAGSRSVYLNNHSGWNSSSISIPVDFVDSSGEAEGVDFADVNGDGYIDIIKAKSSKAVYLGNGNGWTSSSWSFPDDFDNGLRLADLNADGFIDVLKAKSGNRSAWLNNGTAWVENSDWTPLIDFQNDNDLGVRIFDINSDGFPDIVGNGTTYLNNGSGWESSGLVSPIPFVKDGYNTGRRIADVNGDGFVDLVVSYTDNQYTYVKNQSWPNLMKSVRNKLGGITTINYTVSTLFNNTNLGFPVYVVKNISQDNGIDLISNASYLYFSGMYDYERREFRGFNRVLEYRPYSVIEHYFHQDDPRRGKEYQTILMDLNGTFLSKAVKSYNYTFENKLYNLTLDWEASYVYDGLEPDVFNVSYTYDYLGNLLSKNENGRVINYTYAINPIYWIVKPARVDSNNSRTTYYYDNLGYKGVSFSGDLTKIEKWNNYGNHSYQYFTYDDYGNVISETDHLGTTKYTYDGAYVSSAVNALGHVKRMDYDSYGNMLYEEMNGIYTYYYYDDYGRIIREVRPFDTNHSPTKKYVYDFDGTAPESVYVYADEVTEYVYDGFGNLIRIEDDLNHSFYYDNAFRLSVEQFPNNVTYTYDAADRVVKVENSDGSFKSVNYSKKNITDYDENGNFHRYVLDDFGRIVKVYENDEYLTQYEYDSNDNLVRITDNEGNTFNFTYDSLGNKVKMQDPDLGEWTYGYEGNSLVWQQDNRDERIELAYDSLGRLVRKNSSDNAVDFSYDSQYYGTLSTIDYGDKNISYVYDDRLRVVDEEAKAENIILNTEYLYDSYDRIVKSNSIGYIYEDGNLVEIPGYVLADYSYAIDSLTYNNTIVRDYDYDVNMRLSSIESSVMDLNYTYDPVGNILSINDNVFTYDNLDRLVTASLGNNTFKYAYDPIGRIKNIVKNNEAKRLIYTSGPVHAPSKVINVSSGVDVNDITYLEATGRNKTIEFWLISDNETSLSNTLVDFGDGSSFEENISINGSVLGFVSHEYSNGGRYDVNISSGTDFDIEDIWFGTRIGSLKQLYSYLKSFVFELIIDNYMNDESYNVTWQCSGINSSFNVSLGADEDVLTYIQKNYSSTGTFECFVSSEDGNDTEIIEITVPGVEIENYDIMYESTSSRVVGFDVVNYFDSDNVTVNLPNAGNSTVLNNSETLMVFTQEEVDTDGTHTFTVQANDKIHTEEFTMQGVGIEGYERQDNVINFMIRNNWDDGTVDWNMTDPVIVNSSVLDNNETLFVAVQYSDGAHNPIISAKRATYVDRIADSFSIMPLYIKSMLVLNGITEISVVSDGSFDWSYDCEDSLSNSSNESLLVYIANNVTGVAKATFFANSSDYNDTEVRAVIQ